MCSKILETYNKEKNDIFIKYRERAVEILSYKVDDNYEFLTLKL